MAIESGCRGTTDETPAAEVRTTSPLSGFALRDAESAGRRALAVKIDNHADARPQSGLPGAEVVYEELVEGGITRFVAVYLDEEVGEIGPVRSARPADIDILGLIDPLFAVSGGSPLVMGMFEESSLNLVTEDDDQEKYFFRSRERRAPHNLYTSTTLLRACCLEGGINGFAWRDDLFKFGDPGPGNECTNIEVGYPGRCQASYAYDPQEGDYKRSIAGQAHLDKTTGSHIAPTTVIVQYVELEDRGVRDMAGALSPDAVVVGGGEALVFTVGTVRHGSWERGSSAEMTVFRDGEGEEIVINPGQVWIHLIPDGIRVDYL
ncbi:MAG: DUF3048 domain-containing protein [Actinomycetota bacterium]|nr:DUF3048 domain-containing protein [Actinomycetota bacterium]